MSKKRRIASNRFLPQFVSSFRDRHGQIRLRFRRAGMVGGYFKAPLGTEAFREEYRRFNELEASTVIAAQAADLEIVAGTVADLQRRYYALPERLGPTLTTQQKVMSVLDRGFFSGREDRPVTMIAFDHIDAMILHVEQGSRTLKQVGGKVESRPPVNFGKNSFVSSHSPR